MITTIQEYVNKPIPPSEVCIIGTGAAGLELASQLQKTFHSITLLEGGNEAFDWQQQRLYRFKQIGRAIRSPDYTQPFTLETASQLQPRLRQYGGTLNIWGGKWKILEPIDFLSKPYLQESGWPIAYNELYPHYISVALDYRIQDLLWLGTNPDQIPSSIAKLEGFSPSIDILEAVPANPKEKFLAQAKASSAIRLILGASAVNIILSDDLQQAAHLVVRSLDGHEWKLHARLFILACGTIENARLLLHSNTQMRKGIGNSTDWVGRNLLDHPKGFAGLLFPAPHQKAFLEGETFLDKENKRLEIGITLHPSILQKEEIPHHYFNIFPRQLPTGESLYEIKFYLEQLPNAESRLFLSEEYDELGMPLPCLDWKFREEDYVGFKKFIQKTKELLAHHQLGRLEIEEECYNLDFIRDASHQMGTTRMAANPADGVVDINCKVFGINNLYLMGSSVFPAGGNANPTFTILALARRLASHLKRSFLS